MTLPLDRPLPPMEARTVEEIPRGEGWQYEPKWDGFRCLVFRDGGDVELQSKSQKSLTRYFPEVVEALAALRPRQYALDGELVVPVEGALSFDQLLQRIHPAESRVRRLAAEHPAWLVVFDVLARGPKASLLDRPLERRRASLVDFAGRYLEAGRPDRAPAPERASAPGGATVRPTPATRDAEVAARWFRELRGVDGVVAKRLDEPYRVGEREGMVKVKRRRTADCVVGGFRYARSGDGVGSLLLGLYDDEDGLLHHVGFCSAFRDRERRELRGRLEPIVEPPGFTGNAPGGPSRWSKGEASEWEPLRPERVVEVEYDHFTGGRFRHGTRFLRWRPDKAPRQCTLEQIGSEGRGGFRLLTGEAEG